jgi:acetoin utilization protein AcuB
MASKKAAVQKSKAPARPRAASAPLVSAFMTRSVHTIGRDQTLAHAHELMNKYRIRHLPVLDGGVLVGMLSQRDLYFVETLSSDKPDAITVDEAMTQDVFEVGVDEKLASVAKTMQRKKHGCAVVTKGAKVVGVFSTIDALKALLSYLPG